jgi:drug/metabolite transporter (DMT)-like permease
MRAGCGKKRLRDVHVAAEVAMPQAVAMHLVDHPHAARRLRAILMMLASVGLFSLMDTGLKLLSPHYPAFQLAALRGAASLPFVLAWALSTTGVAPLLRVRWSLHLLRGVLGVGMMACFVYALRTLPLSTAYSIFFVAPLLITALSVPILGESVGWRRWTAVGVGFIGVMVMLRPGAGMANPAVLGALFSAVVNAVGFLLLRRFIASENRISFGFYANTTTAIVTGLMMLAFGGVMPELRDLLAIAIGGVLGGTAYLFVTNAYRQAPAAVVAPFQYSQMIWGVVSGYLLWQDVPDPTMLIGCGIVIASGLYILHRETVRQAPVAQGATPAATVASVSSPIRTSPDHG